MLTAPSANPRSARVATSRLLSAVALAGIQRFVIAKSPRVASYAFGGSTYRPLIIHFSTSPRQWLSPLRARGRKSVFHDQQAPAVWIAHVSVVAIIRRGAMRAFCCLCGAENRCRAFGGDSNYRHRATLLSWQIDVSEMRIISDDVPSRSGHGASQLRSRVQVQHGPFPFVASHEDKSPSTIHPDSSSAPTSVFPPS